jgi:Predicted phosphatases
MSSPSLSFAAKHDAMIACDSDGCVFDVMDLKHRECFCPAFIKHFRLQRCARQARDVWEFVNLQSRTRGSNRFAALGLALKLLAEHPEVRGRGIAFMDFSALNHFLATSPSLGEPALAQACAATDDPALHAALAWTREVNAAVAAMCKGLGPFPGVDDALRRASAGADIVVVSQAPRATLLDEWTHAGLTAHTALVAGQEFGSKAAQIREAAKGRYAPQRILVVGDAPGDQEAARAVGARFFPIIPGDEIASWRRFVDEAYPRFECGSFDDAYQAELDSRFDAALPSSPPWMAE